MLPTSWLEFNLSDESENVLVGYNGDKPQWVLKTASVEELLRKLNEVKVTAKTWKVAPAGKKIPVISAGQVELPYIDVKNTNSPNFSDRKGVAITHIVLHNTDGKFDPSVSWLCNPEAQASAHLVIGRDGRVASLVPFAKKAWHAGSSKWNSCSIGIELEASKSAQGLTPAQEVILLEWLKGLLKVYSIPKENIILHRNVCETDCPGWVWKTDADFKKWLESKLT